MDTLRNILRWFVIGVGLFGGLAFLWCLFFHRPPATASFDTFLYEAFLACASLFFFSFSFATWRMK